MKFLTWFYGLSAGALLFSFAKEAAQGTDDYTSLGIGIVMLTFYTLDLMLLERP